MSTGAWDVGGGVLTTYDEAERKPRVLLDHMARVVAAVMTPADDAVITFDLFAECMLPAGEY